MKKLIKKIGGKRLSIIYRPILSRLDNINTQSAHQNDILTD